VDEAEVLPKVEFAFPGPLRDRLLAAILDGDKTATASLRIEYAPSTIEPLPQPGCRAAVADSAHRPVAVFGTTAVAVVRDWRQGRIQV
jgi:uncharacterized protein YhfF